MTCSSQSALRRWTRLTATGAIVSGMLASAAAAHDFYLLPSRFTAARGATLPADLTVSAAFPKLENVVATDRVAEMKVTGAGRGAALESAGAGPNSLRLRFHGHQPGWAVLSVRAVPRDVEYAEDRIGPIMEEYEVGPEASRAVANLQKPRVLKVSSRRFAKSLVCVERCRAAGEAARPVGHDVEFVAVAGAPHTFRLLSGGQALADYPVAVVASDGERRRLRTGAGGVVALPADAKGPVMLFASVMEPPRSPDAPFTLKLASMTVPGR